MSSLTERWPVRRLLSRGNAHREESGMARRDTSPDFIEALARGLDVIRAFGPRQRAMSLAAVADATGLARPTARRILLTLTQLGYVRPADGGFQLTARVLDLGMSYVLSQNLWEGARPHMEDLVSRTHESSSIAQLDGSDIVYAARGAAARGGRAGARRAEPLRDHRPVAARARGAGRHAARGGRARLGADRRAARPGDPVGGGAAAGRRGAGDRRHERDRACRGDAGGRPHR